MMSTSEPSDAQLEERRAMQEERNLGAQPSPDGQTEAETMSPQDERTWSIIAHLSVLAALVGLMPLGALIVWLIYKDRSPRVRFHAAQAFWYQAAWLVILLVYTLISVVLSLVVIGIFMLFLVPIIALVPLVHGCYAAYQVSQGVEYRYPFIADRVDGGAGSVL
jgi:uncharacterized Tic20 family protein